MPELTFKQALELTGGPGQHAMVWIRDGSGATAEPMSPHAALVKHGGRTVARIEPVYNDDHRYCGMAFTVTETGTGPEIFVCVEGGIVNDVYAKGLPEDASVTVLDVDSDRADAEPIRDYWDGIAAKPDEYPRLDMAFYDPLGEEED